MKVLALEVQQYKTILLKREISELTEDFTHNKHTYTR